VEPEKLATIAKMRALGWSQREIAEEIGVSQPSVAYQLSKLKQKSKEGSKEEVLSKVLLSGFLDSLSGSALMKFLQFSDTDDEAESSLSPDTFDDAI
jgi:transcriptional regulator with XRE-family HTH domain|tara:strand:- start:250 stop:540 length:291 start_codon:yes stop_codon:yes gene_type:complete